MKQIYLLSIFLLCWFGATNNILAQDAPIASQCKKYISPPFISSGQIHKSLVRGDAEAEFRSTFYSGTTYRVVVCSDVEGNKPVFTLYDNENHKLFSNQKHNYSPYWDFQFESTVDCIIKVRFKEALEKPAYLILMVGFKE